MLASGGFGAIMACSSTPFGEIPDAQEAGAVIEAGGGADTGSDARGPDGSPPDSGEDARTEAGA